MKPYKFTSARITITVLAILLPFLPAQPRARSEAPPPPASTEQVDQVKAAIQQTIESNREQVLAFQLYDLSVENVQVSDDRQWAAAQLIQHNPQTGFVVPGEPGLALLQWGETTWDVTLPGDPGWEYRVRTAPEDLIPANEKVAWLEMYATHQGEAPSGPLSGYLLPWAGGESIVLTRSFSHYNPPNPTGSMHYAFDFAHRWDNTGTSPMFEVYAAKAGVVKYAVWNFENGDETHANYLVLQDSTTSPTSFQVYLHLAKDSIPPALRVVGTVVQQGQYLAMADDTGYSTANHLHFQVHTNPSSYWGTAVDIVFGDVSINGGRPRTPVEASNYPEYGSQGKWDYISGNTVHGNGSPPTGDLTAPTTGMNLQSSVLSLTGWATDEDSDFQSAQFIANFGDAWHDVGPEFSSSPFSYDWDVCSGEVPDGPVSVALRLEDAAGNVNLSLPGLRHLTKNFNCPVQPPACTPGSSQVALFARSDYSGKCITLDIGSYPNAASLGTLGDNQAVSIQVGNSVRATVYKDENLQGRGETFIGNDSNLGDNRISASTLSSLLVQPNSASPATPSPSWPVDGAQFTASSSVSLIWEDKGGGEQFQAQLIGPGGTVTLPWQSSTVWHLGSLAYGNYTWHVRAANSAGQSGWSNAFTIGVQSAAYSAAPPVNTSPTSETPMLVAPFSDNMENGVNGWSNSSLWDLDTKQNHTSSGSTSWWYGVDATSNYNTGAPNTGDLTSPAIQIPASGIYYLRFWYWYQTEGNGLNWDQRWVQISADGGPFTNLLQLSDDPARWWLQGPAISLAGYAGKTVRVRFHFESLDSAWNSYSGWYIDDFSINATQPAGCSDTDNTPAQATQIAYGDSAFAAICPGGDVDYYRFSATSGDQVGIRIDAQAEDSPLDSYVYLYDSDGVSELAHNDDQIAYARTDSFLGYRLTRSGDYYIKVKAWDHPSAGGTSHTYHIKLYSDSVDPAATLTYPLSDSYLPKAQVTLAAAASDQSSGISHVDFLWHSSDWASGSWNLQESDWNGMDGWSTTFDASQLNDGDRLAFLIRAYDHAGNFVANASWNVGVDGTPPVTAIQPFTSPQNSTAVRVTWEASDNLSGLDHFDIQQQVNGGAWANWLSSWPGDRRIAWLVGNMGQTYGFRMRGADRAGNANSYPASAETSTTIPAAVCSSGDIWENDNTPGSSPLVTGSNITQIHTYCNPNAGSGWLNDEDWLRIQVQAGNLLLVESLPQGGELANAASLIELYDGPGGALLASGAPQPMGGTVLGAISQILWFSDQSRVVYLRLRHSDGRVAGDGVIYQLRIVQGPPVYLPMLQHSTPQG